MGAVEYIHIERRQTPTQSWRPIYYMSLRSIVRAVFHYRPFGEYKMGIRYRRATHALVCNTRYTEKNKSNLGGGMLLYCRKNKSMLKHLAFLAYPNDMSFRIFRKGHTVDNLSFILKTCPIEMSLRKFMSVHPTQQQRGSGRSRR